jgi:hypothetical protein
MQQQINNLLDVKIIEERRKQWKRNYLGASIIGDECLRKIQLQYMQNNPNFSAQILRTFDIGSHLEGLVAEWLRIAGFDLRTQNDNGEQFGFSTADGKIAGHCDGIIYGNPLDFCCPCLWECKTMNNKNWNDTKKRGVQISKPIYYVQVQLYMAYMNLDENPCLFTILNKDSSELYHELIPFDAETAQRYSDRAMLIIQASKNNELLPRISNDPSFYRCKMCAHQKSCRQPQGD